VWIAPLDPKSPLAEDYVIIDDRIAGRLTLSLDRNPVQAQFYFDKDKVDEIRAQIQLVAANAQRYGSHLDSDGT
jgi:hypothetical protein